MAKYYIVVSRSCPCFFIFAEHISYILTKNNISNLICLDSIPMSTETVFESTNAIILWNNISLPKPIRFEKIYVYNFDTVLIKRVGDEIIRCLEEFSKMCNELTVINFSSNEFDRSFFNSLNFNYTVLKYGYSDFHENVYSQVPLQEKKFDVLFYGAVTEYRIPRLQSLKDFCSKKGYTLCIVSSVFDERQKALLVSQSKIVVTIPSSEFVKEAGTNDLCRLSFLIANKAFFICEKIGGDVEEDLVSYGFPCVDNELMFHEKIDYYLTHETEARQISEQAYSEFKQKYNFETKLLEILS